MSQYTLLYIRIYYNRGNYIILYNILQKIYWFILLFYIRKELLLI